MQINSLCIINFKSIQRLEIKDIESALILVGKNNSGKTVVLDAIRAVTGNYQVQESDFNEKKQNIEITMELEISREDLQQLHDRGSVSSYKRYDSWEKDFLKKLPSFVEGKLSFVCVINRNSQIRYDDGTHKNNQYIPMILPKLHFVDTTRNISSFQEDLLIFQKAEELSCLRSNACIFNEAKNCSHCFNCIGLLQKKSPASLSLQETAKLLEYKIYQLNLNDFTIRMNENYQKNGGVQEIVYTMKYDPDKLFSIKADAWHEDLKRLGPVDKLGNGMKSIYMLSLLETYIEDEKRMQSIIMVEYPELFLHPSLQKAASKILYQLSKKNQVIFTTHSPNMVVNFTRGQVCQMSLDEDGYSIARQNVDIDVILNDLGYSANDLLNVDFVFIVEGKQDKSRFPMLLKKYYSEIYDKEGQLSRIAIITTNSCTNIKTYANLKYMNQLYLRDQFLMIRDGDGKDPQELVGQLCNYYSERNVRDVDKLPRVQSRNVLVLKYYSFENYFLNPEIMVQIGVVESVDQFWEILFDKWKQYLHRIKSGMHLKEVLGRDLESIEDLKNYFEEFKIYMRGHNLYDIFYGPFRERETELLTQYLELAPREDFADILEKIDSFIYFHSRKK